MMQNDSNGVRVPYFGDFFIVAEIGRGGMGVVYEAQQTSLNRPVALKILHPHLASNHLFIQRLRLEAEAGARLQHGNIVPIFEVGEHEGSHYLAMQLVAGTSLAEHLSRQTTFMVEGTAARLLSVITRAVHHAHERGVLHRDLKPGNILIDPQGVPHLIDFGLAKCLEHDASMTQTGAFLGTPAYASPEQVSGRHDQVTTSSDVYSLGAILYCLLTGRPPFQSGSVLETIEQVRHAEPPSPRKIRPGLSTDLEIICLKCLAKEPARRYVSAQALAKDLDAFCEGRPIAARPVGVLERLWLWAKRNPVHAALWFAAGLVLLGSILGVWLWQDLRQKARENEQLLELGSSISVSRTRYPRRMGWAGEIQRSLSPERVLIQKPYYRDQMAATLEGIDARLIGAASFSHVRHLSFADHSVVRLVGTNGAMDWPLHHTPLSLEIQPTKHSSRPVSYLREAPLVVGLAPTGGLVVWQEQDAPAQTNLTALAGSESFGGTARIFSSVAPAADTLVLATNLAGDGATLSFWNLGSGRLIRSITVDSKIAEIALSTDGSLVACGTPSGQVLIWEVASGNSRPSFRVSDFPVTSLAMTCNPRRVFGRTDWLIAAGDASGSIAIWDATRQRMQSICRGGHYQVFALAFNPDATLLASSGRGPVRLWDVATGMALLDLGGDATAFVAFSADGRRVAASCEHRSGSPWRHVMCWEIENGRGIATLKGLSSSATKLTLSTDGRFLAAVGIAWEVAVWDLQQQRLLSLLDGPRGVTADNCAIAFSPDGSQLAMVAGREARLWEASTGENKRSWRLPGGYVDSLAFPSEDGLYLLRTESTNRVRLRNLLSVAPLDPIQEFADFNVVTFDAARTVDGKFFVVEGIGETNRVRSRKLIVLESRTGRIVREIPSIKPDSWAMNVLSSHNAHLAYTLDGTNNLAVDLNDPGRPPVAIPFQPAALGPTLHLWAARGESALAGRGLSVFEGTTRTVTLGMDAELMNCAAFDSTGRWLAWGNKDGSVSLCDLQRLSREIQTAPLTR